MRRALIRIFPGHAKPPGGAYIHNCLTRPVRRIFSWGMGAMEKDTRQRILDAAKAIFSEKGYTKTGVSDITEMADIAKGSFYTYFRNKHDIFMVILDEFIGGLEAILSRIRTADIRDMETYRAASLMTGVAVGEHFLRNRQLARLFFWEAMGLDPDMERKIDEAYDMIGGHVGRLVDRGVELGLLRGEVSREMLVDSIVGFGTYLIRRYLKGAYNDLSVERIIGDISIIHFNGTAAAGK